MAAQGGWVAATDVLNTLDTALRLGNRQSGLAWATAGMVLDNVRVYNRALTADEVGQLYVRDAGNLDQDGDGLTDAWEQGYGRYQIITGNFTWEQAKSDAEARNGHLATITSGNEWNAMETILGEPMTRDGSRWIGGSDVSQEGSWRWITGEVWNYTNWAPNEPQDFGQEDYLQLYNTGQENR